MDNIYAMPDTLIQKRIGEKLKAARLKQNITQQSLARSADISVSSLKKIESGQIGTFESLLRCLRTLGYFEWILPLVEEERMSPSELYAMRHSAQKPTRKRAAGQLTHKEKEEPAW